MDKNKVFAGVAIASLVLAGGFAAHDVLEKPKIVEVEKLVPVEKVIEKEVKIEVPVEVIKTVEKTIEVPVEDEAFLKLVCDRAMFDDLMECKEEIKAEDAALKKALALVESDFAEELEDADIVEDERDVSMLKLFSSYEDVEVVSSDFDDESYEFKITARVDDEEAEEKFKVEFTVEVVDGKAKILDVEQI